MEEVEKVEKVEEVEKVEKVEEVEKVEKVEEVEKVERGNKMKKIGILSVALLVCGTAFAMLFDEEFCDFTLNVDARDGHTPPDTNRYFVACATNHYEAHPSSVMLPDDRTILAFWDWRQAGPCGRAAVSADAGRTWTRIDDRLPKEFSECHDEPKAYRFIDPKTGKARIRVFASYGTALWWSWRGPAERPLAEAMPSILSEDDGRTWRYLPPLGTNFACVVCFSGMVRLDDGSYLGVFSRGSQPNGEGGPYRVMGSVSRDGGLTWETPFEIAGKGGSFFLPTVFRSPDGKELCVLASNWGYYGHPAVVCFSKNEGRTWTAPRPAPSGLDGDSHAVAQVADGRLAVALRRGTVVTGWLGEYGQLRRGKGGSGENIKLFHSYGEDFGAGSPNLHVRKDGEIVVVAHAQNDLRHPLPGIVAMRFTAEEVDREIKMRIEAQRNFMEWEPFKGTPFKPLRAARHYGPFVLDIMGKYRQPFDGSKLYISRAVGDTFSEIENDKGTFVGEKLRKHLSGDAMIVVWTVAVPEDCKARLRIIGSPMARCCLRGRCVLPAVGSTIFDQRTTEIELKKGENELSLLVWIPHDRAAIAAGWDKFPIRFALGLDCKSFKCLHPGRNLELKEEISIDDVLSFD